MGIIMDMETFNVDEAGTFAELPLGIHAGIVTSVRTHRGKFNDEGQSYGVIVEIAANTATHIEPGAVDEDGEPVRVKWVNGGKTLPTSTYQYLGRLSGDEDTPDEERKLKWSNTSFTLRGLAALGFHPGAGKVSEARLVSEPLGIVVAFNVVPHQFPSKETGEDGKAKIIFTTKPDNIVPYLELDAPLRFGPVPASKDGSPQPAF